MYVLSATLGRSSVGDGIITNIFCINISTNSPPSRQNFWPSHIYICLCRTVAGMPSAWICTVTVSVPQFRIAETANSLENALCLLLVFVIIVCYYCYCVVIITCYYYCLLLLFVYVVNVVCFCCFIYS